MDHNTTGVIAGFDCHADSHAAVIINPVGQLLAKRQFPTTTSGHDQAIEWVRSHGSILAAGVESTGSYGAGLTRALTETGIAVTEVNRPHAHTRARRGKDDFIDAEAAARKVLSGEATVTAKDTTGIVESIRQLTVARAGAVKGRTAAMNQLSGLIISAPVELRAQLDNHTSTESKAKTCAGFRPATTGHDPLWAAKTALRSVGRRINELSSEIAVLDDEIDRLVSITAPATLDQFGVGPNHAATLLIAAGQNAERFSSESAFANLCGVAPLPASSGRTTRHRLNPGGNRQANRALHMIVIVRLRYCPETKTYMERRLTEGRTKKEIIRCLKRYIARDLYRTVRADLATTNKRLDNL